MPRRNSFLNLAVNGNSRTVALYLCFSSFALGVAAIAWPVLAHKGFPLDDSWIHQVIGRNVANFGIPGFSPGVASSGSSSALWPWIIAFNYRFVPWLDPVFYLLALNAFFLLVVTLVLFASAAEDDLPPLEIGLLAALPMLTGNFVWLISIGMEHLLLVAMVFSAAYVWLLRKQELARPSALLAGMLCGIAILTRPEAVIFPPIFLIAAWRLGKPRGDLAAFAAPCALAAVLVCLNNLWTSNALLPVTFSGRRWLYFGDRPAALPFLALNFGQQWLQRIVKYFVGFDVGPVGNIAISLPIVAVMALGVWRLARRGAWRILFLLLLAAADFTVYTAMLPSDAHGGRYVAMALVFVFPLIGLGALEIVDAGAARLKLASAAGFGHAATTTAVALLALSSLATWSAITEAGVAHINATHVRMGKWIAANLGPDAKVASFDIGAITYFSKARIIDLGGLTNPDFIPYLYGHNAADYLKERGAGWVVMPAAATADEPNARAAGALVGALKQLFRSPELEEPLDVRLGLDEGSGPKKREIIAFSGDRDAWERGFRATGHAAEQQVLYEVVEPGMFREASSDRSTERDRFSPKMIPVK